MGRDNIDGNETISESTATETAEAADKAANGEVMPSPKRQKLISLYKEFRSSGLSKMDSAFNAVYICQTNRFCSRTVDVNNVGKGFFAHPKGWFKEREERVRRASGTKTLRTMELAAKLLAPFSRSVESVKVRSGFFFDNSVVTIKNVAGSFKKAVPICLIAVCVALLGTAVYIDSEKSTVIEFSVDGVPVGQVASVKTVDEALNRVNSKISSITGQTFSFPYEISYTLKNTAKAHCLDLNGVCDILGGYVDGYTVEGYGLYIDSELIAVMDNRDDILDVLETVKTEHMKLTGETEDIANKIDIRYQEYSPKDVTTKDELLSMFSIENTAENEQTVQPTQALLAVPVSPTTLSLSGATDEFREMIESSLPENESNAIVLDFEVFYEETVREAVPYETEYVKDDLLFKGQEVIKTAGRNGTADNTYKVKYIEGVESGRELLEQRVIKEPRTRVVRVGTRELPELLTIKENGGRYMINPVPAARVSSHYGWRVLRGVRSFHYGLDLAAMIGTPVYAAASGEVIYAGYNASYGNHVKIRHADGLVTLYGHCSELFVKTGDTVSQADEIGLVGSTGNSTGYHCHFEVYEDDERKDPEKYIYSLD